MEEGLRPWAAPGLPQAFSAAARWQISAECWARAQILFPLTSIWAQCWFVRHNWWTPNGLQKYGPASGQRCAAVHFDVIENRQNSISIWA